ncbi:MAG: hypothetical protein SYC29_05215 [Planctomycetota bacterium]|nr:hypothetical protein [Planctomycetota bacterium]
MTRTIDPYDELAAMFLTEAEAPQPWHEEAGQRTIELLMVGHLPVRAGLWLPPYADAIARRVGTTVLVRLDGEEATLQVLRSAEGQPAIDDCRNLREAILTLGPAPRAWIVRPSSRVEGGDLLTAPADRITILSSADQAAVVNAYRLVKDLAESADQRERPAPALALAVIGAEREAAEEVARRLDRTTRECLDVPVPLLMYLPRIDAAVRSSSLKSFPGQARPALEEVLAWIDEARTRRPAATTGGIDGVREPQPTAEEPRSHASPAAARAMEAEETEPARSAGPAPPVEVDLTPDAGGRRTIKLTPRAEAEVEPKEPLSPVEPDEGGGPVSLAAHVAGLEAIAPRCPGHERIELAVDAKGCIHLLGREQALREMPVVTAWARAHRELLAMACPDHHFDPAGEIISHLFTDEPARVADLQSSDLHLHVLAPVEIAGKRGWYAAPLNAPHAHGG